MKASTCEAGLPRGADSAEPLPRLNGAALGNQRRARHGSPHLRRQVRQLRA